MRLLTINFQDFRGCNEIWAHVSSLVHCDLWLRINPFESLSPFDRNLTVIRLSKIVLELSLSDVASNHQRPRLYSPKGIPDDDAEPQIRTELAQIILVKELKIDKGCRRRVWAAARNAWDKNFAGGGQCGGSMGLISSRLIKWEPQNHFENHKCAPPLS